MKSGWITVNVPKMLLDDVGKSSKKIDPFTPEERDKLLSGLKGTPLLYWTIRFFMGLRPGEVLALLWPDARGDSFSVTKSTRSGIVGPTKTGINRDVPIHPRVAKLLKTHPRRFDCASIIHHQTMAGVGIPYATSNVMNRPLKKVMKKEGIRYRNPYNARHTCAAMMLTGGMEPAQCAEFLGHSLKTFFEDYASVINGNQTRTQAQIWASLE